MNENVLSFHQDEIRPGRGAAQRGSALFLAILLMSILALIPIMMNMNVLSSENTKVQRNIILMADNISRAGLMDGLKWFRKQPIQPVSGRGLAYPDAAFNPLYNSLNPAEGDTMDPSDPSVGIVKEYELSDKYTYTTSEGETVNIGKNPLWVRYEVPRQGTDGFNPVAVHDVSRLRMQGSKAGDGNVWQIESIGYVYRLSDPAKRFNEAPNQVIAKSHTGMEIWRLGVNLPGDPALTVNNISSVTILNPSSGIFGRSHIGISFSTWSKEGDDKVFGSSVTGNPAVMNVSTTPIDTTGVFGVPPGRLKELANNVVTKFEDLPRFGSDLLLPDLQLIYVANSATYGDMLPHRLNQVIFVDGDLWINVQTLTDYRLDIQGLLFVNGNLRISSPCVIRGSVVVTGQVIIDGPAVTLSYDAEVLSSVKKALGQYRENKASIRSTTDYFN